jgi:hypothetical protein
MEEETSWYEDQIPEDCYGYDGNDGDIYWGSWYDECDCIFPEFDCREKKCRFRDECFHPKTWEGLKKEE